MFKESENGQTHFCSECERLSRELQKKDKTTRLIARNSYENDRAWFCKACGETRTFEEFTPQQDSYKYCCNCGARIIEYRESEE